jgi:hypothetical protein
MKKLTLLGFLLFLPALAGGYFLATEQIGPDPPGRPTFEQPDWPRGLVDLARLQTRVYSRWVNGDERFFFQADIQGVNEILSLFSRVRIEEHDLLFGTGEGRLQTFRGLPIEYNVELHVPGGISLAFNTRVGQQVQSEPELILLVGSNPELLGRLSIPANTRVQAGDQIKSRLPREVDFEKPAKAIYFGRVAFADGTPAAPQFSIHIRTYVVRWDEGYSEGIRVAEVNSNGLFSINAAEKDMEAYRSGRRRLTVHTGQSWKDGLEKGVTFPVAYLSKNMDEAKTLTIGRAESIYYGRILFEDGSPALLDKAQWGNLRLRVGDLAAEIDEQGYFQIYLRDEEYQERKVGNERLLIYLPDPQRPGRSVGKPLFPVGLLSRDKASAGTITIPRPVR